MKKSSRTGHILRLFAANLALAAIVAGLFALLGLSAGEAVSASAQPAGFSQGLPISAAVYRGRKRPKGERGRAALLVAVSWDAAALEKILETLDKYGVKATFSVSGEWAQRNPDTLLSLAIGGHELAASCGSTGGGYDAVREGLRRTAETIRAVTGAAPKLFYCGESVSASEARAARAEAMTTVIGSMDIMCLRGSAADILARVKGNTKDGDIIICTPTAAFSEALSDILEYFSAMDLTATTVGGTIYD